MRDLAFDAAAGPLAGGHRRRLQHRPPRAAWAYLLAEMVEVELPEELPAQWLAHGQGARGGVYFTPRLSGDWPLEIDAATRARADAEANETIDAARALHRPGLVLDPLVQPGDDRVGQLRVASAKTWSAPGIVVRNTLGQSPWRARVSSSPPSDVAHQLVVAGLDQGQRHRDPAHAQARLGVRGARAAREPPGAVRPDLAVERAARRSPGPAAR